MTKRGFAMALLVTFVLAGAITLRSYEGHRNLNQVSELNAQLQRTQGELEQTRVQLADANRKLGFLEATKAHVQVTAYALTPEFGPDPVFSNNSPARTAYAVPKHTLPAGKMLNVALSPLAERKLHANLNDTLVLTTRRGGNKYLARFVDRTAQSETRPVVDVLFADAHQARIWGRRSFYAVNISRADSPFRAE
ncbi:MAG TPA: hypothetical protein VL156_06535 [Terriglobales bacterium]|jgi:hypothetical protein|nr:hypothetical protein [Terriglobales bacterium]